MTTLADLKAGHPEWCWVCGWEMDQSTHETLISHTGGIGSPVIAALIAKALEDEARIKELTQRDPYWYDASPADAFSMLTAAHEKIAELRDDLKIQIGRSEGKNIIIHELEAKLSAEQAVHAATKEELRKAEEAIQQQARELEGIIKAGNELRRWSVWSEDQNKETYRLGESALRPCFVASQGRKIWDEALARIQAQRAALKGGQP